MLSTSRAPLRHVPLLAPFPIPSLPNPPPPPELTPSKSSIGTITGSQAWSTSGEHDKTHARAALQAAVEHRDPAKAGYGRAEEIAGKLTGCEGMKHEGAASRNKRQD